MRRSERRAPRTPDPPATMSNSSASASPASPTFHHDGSGYWYLVGADGSGLCGDSPRLLACESDWKVSPGGDNDPDTGCYWVDTWDEAKAELLELRAN